MKRKRTFAFATLAVLLIASLALYLGACSSGGGSSSTPGSTTNTGGNNTGGNNTGTTTTTTATVGSPTSLATTTQGAQSAAVGMNLMQSGSSDGNMLSSLVGAGSAAPQFTLPGASTKPSPALAALVKKTGPLAAEARSLRSSLLPVTGTPANCAYGGTKTVSYDLSGNVTLSFASCNDGMDLMSGSMILTNGTPTSTLVVGTSGSPFSDKSCTDSTCTSFSDVTTAVVTITSVMTTGTNGSANEAITADGSVTDVNNDNQTTDVATLNQFRISIASSTTTTNTIAGQPATFYESDFSLNGAASTQHTEPNNNYGESITYQNFTISTLTDGATTYYMSIDGTAAVASNPTDLCIDGTFVFHTITPIAMDLTTANSLTVAGEFTINTVTDVLFNSNGTVTITVNGTPQDINSLYGVCAF